MAKKPAKQLASTAYHEAGHPVAAIELKRPFGCCYNVRVSEGQSEDRPPDESADRSHMHLQCIGSFEAYTQDGKSHTIEIWTHFGAVHDRELARVAPSLLVLTTTDGQGVDRIDQGEYRLTDNPEVSLSTDDPNAP